MVLIKSSGKDKVKFDLKLDLLQTACPFFKAHTALRRFGAALVKPRKVRISIFLSFFFLTFSDNLYIVIDGNFLFPIV